MKIDTLELAAAAAYVLFDSAVEYQDGSDNTALVNLCAADLHDFSHESHDKEKVQQLARDIVQDGERLYRVSTEFEERALGLLMVHLFKDLADGSASLFKEPASKSA